jgi:hypothetical protein
MNLFTQISNASNEQLAQLEAAISVRRDELRKLSRQRRLEVPSIDEHFLDFTDGLPPRLRRSNIAAGRQFRLTPEQMAFVRGRVGKLATAVIVPIEVNYGLDGNALGFRASVAISPKRAAGVRAFVISDEDAEVFFRLEREADERYAARDRAKEQKRELSSKAKQDALLKALLS